jgi:hypothetical protein
VLVIDKANSERFKVSLGSVGFARRGTLSDLSIFCQQDIFRRLMQAAKFMVAELWDSQTI